MTSAFLIIGAFQSSFKELVPDSTVTCILESRSVVIDDIRSMRYSPTLLLVFKDASLLSSACASALLKPVEEQLASFIFLADTSFRVSAPLASRCRIIVSPPFKFVSKEAFFQRYSDDVQKAVKACLGLEKIPRSFFYGKTIDWRTVGSALLQAFSCRDVFDTVPVDRWKLVHSLIDRDYSSKHVFYYLMGGVT